MILIATDAAVIAAVTAAAPDTAVYERVGQAAAAGALNGAEVLVDRGAAVTAAAVGHKAAMLVVTGNAGSDMFALADMIGAERVVSLPAGAAWLATEAGAR